jgi:hypothetical protein
MNERIKQLAEQAGYTEAHYESDDGPFVPAEFNKEKFAELIVRECDYLIQQQVSLKYKDGWEQDGITDDWAYGHYAASILSRTVIKQHFGVKE